MVGKGIRLMVLALVLLAGLGACEGKRQSSPYEGTFINRGGGP